MAKSVIDADSGSEHAMTSGAASASPGKPAGNHSRTVVLCVIFCVLILGDQVTKWWAWRHIGRVSIDTGGGVFDEFVGGLANSAMADPLMGAALDVVAAALLVWCGHRLVSRSRAWRVLIVICVLLAASTSNLLDRIGMHTVTAPGSTRGVVNWIGLGGSGASPLNVADLLTTVASLALVAIVVVRQLRRRVHSRAGRAVAGTVTAAAVLLSLAGAVNASNGMQLHSPAATSRTAPVRASAGPARRDFGAPPVVAGSAQDSVLDVATVGSRVVVTWATETVTVSGRTVLGWRRDGVSALYLRVLVVGPTTVEIYLPPPAAGHAMCQWFRPGPRTRTTDRWECDPGVAPLTLARLPILYP